MKRSKPLLRTAMSPRATIKPKVCAWCREDFFPARPMQKVCGPVCGAHVGRQKTAAAALKAQREERKATRAAKEAAKGVQVLKKEAQEAFNEYVRLRDVGKGCFVCGVPLQLGGLGGGFDAGHIRSRSQADHLRFDERNVHGQCKHCNAPGATKDHVMREAAARLLGQEVADALYADNRVHKWQRDELREIRDTSRARARQLRKERA
ncbi:recombination protein NinG [Pelomonas sp. V22]|uniref:recombination protein NinG n=1 Tax=Pelomonas sp. V22 TaxID=2822139 RepID=UPI0024A8BD70|nr:recombination protein NinG [Pelomonas sp. V22]MDI4633311.1 recombination protein NinG [Pelomonas sp. V22]